MAPKRTGMYSPTAHIVLLSLPRDLASWPTHAPNFQSRNAAHRWNRTSSVPRTMRRPRDVALRTGLYIAVTLSSFAAAYVLKEWLPHLWGEARNTTRALPASDSPDDDDKTSPRSSLQQDRSPKTAAHLRQIDEVPPAPVTDTDPDHTLPAPSPNTHARTPSTGQTRTLPPLDTHSLPPPLPNGHALFSGPSFADTILSPTSVGTFHTSSGEDGVGDEAASQTNTPDTLEESFVDVLSPAPAHEISRQRSVRAHDLFAASHISFAELGSFVAPQNVPK